MFKDYWARFIRTPFNVLCYRATVLFYRTDNVIPIIKRFMAHLFHNVNYRILWLEQLLISVIIGASLHSWPVACCMLLGLSWILNRQKGPFYMIFILSFLWALAAMAFGYCLGGWGWGVASGVIIFICGLGIHFRDLKQPLYDVPDEKPVEMEPWPWARQNLN